MANRATSPFSVPPMLINLPHQFAIVRLAYYGSKGQNARLVFVCVELLPPGRAEPDEVALEQSGRPPSFKTKHGHLYFLRLGMPAQEALEWYRALDTLPSQAGSTAATKMKLDHAALEDEPFWGPDFNANLTVPLPEPLCPGPAEDNRINPFSGANRESIRVHRRLAPADAMEGPLFDLLRDPKRNAREWLRLRTWVDFDRYPELLGSAVLIAPDPEMRGVDMRRERDDAGDDSLVIEVAWRSKPATDLTLIVREERFGGVVWHKAFDVPQSGILRIPRPQRVSQIGWDLVHPTRGLLCTQPPVGFMSAFSLTSRILRSGTPFTSTDGRAEKAPRSTRPVAEVSHETFHTGAPHLPPGRIAQGCERRRLARQEGTEFWLDDPTRARDKLWAMIARARSDVLLVDPYADGKDLEDYGMASSGAPVRLLTAAKSTTDGSPDTIEEGLRAMAKAGKRAEARRMEKGLHDRFVKLDGAVWSLGSSLNGLGQHATMLIRLSMPEPVAERLELLWSQAARIDPSDG